MRQVVVIHGGTAYASYDAYLAALETAVVDEASLHQRPGWKSTLADALGGGYEVLLPRMPNAQNARYREWKLWFEKHVPFLRPGAILVGHSLGGAFLGTYLNEMPLPVRVSGTLLVAAPYDSDGEQAIPEFAIAGPLDQFAQQGGAITLYHSTDDPVVAYREVEKYTAALPHATVRTFEDRQHFNQETFPELVLDIQRL